MIGCFFFFSSRRRHTRWTGDWSSDVCSSDLWLDSWQRHLCRFHRRRDGPRWVGLGQRDGWNGHAGRANGWHGRSRWIDRGWHRCRRRVLWWPDARWLGRRDRPLRRYNLWWLRRWHRRLWRVYLLWTIRESSWRRRDGRRCGGGE